MTTVSRHGLFSLLSAAAAVPAAAATVTAIGDAGKREETRKSSEPLVYGTLHPLCKCGSHMWTRRSEPGATAYKAFCIREDCDRYGMVLEIELPRLNARALSPPIDPHEWWFDGVRDCYINLKTGEARAAYEFPASF